MPNLLLRILSHEWLAVIVGAAIALLGVVLWSVARDTALASFLSLTGAVLMTGGTIHLLRIARHRRLHPPPGVLVDLGGYRLHVLAQGEKQGHPSIVWLGGGHAAGAVMHHLHEALRTATRSILVDRPGTGWSDTGPFPRTTAREAEEVVAALRQAGETGPYVWVGYSFGGLLAGNIARRYPELVATLVLLDPTPLEMIVFGPRLGRLDEMRRDALLSGLLRLVGFPADLHASRIRHNTAYAQMTSQFEAAIGSALPTMRAIECTAGSRFAHYSISQELSHEGAAACAWETVIYDGDLGDLPIVLMVPASAREMTKLPAVTGASAAEANRMHRFFARSRERYLATSTHSRRIYTPEGTTHQFVYERPDFVVTTIRDLVAGLRA